MPLVARLVDRASEPREMETTRSEATSNVAIATCTLLAAGYTISGVHRQPAHIEFKCERISRLGPTVQFLIAITDRAEFSEDEAHDIAHAAANQNRLSVLVSKSGGSGQLTWTEFLDVMGGAVPSWKALTDEYRDRLETASRNVSSSGLIGEAWWIFESLVADGLEFCFGRRVNRLGGQQRGKRVSDMVAPLPDFNVVVVDTKATVGGFNAIAGSLRALVEYVNKQKQRQQGGGDVVAALVVVLWLPTRRGRSGRCSERVSRRHSDSVVFHDRCRSLVYGADASR
jgi:hypothetical protein